MRAGYVVSQSSSRPQRAGTVPRPEITIQTATIRDFSGGWDSTTNEIALTSKFSRVMRNVSLGNSGTIDIRYGTKLFADVAAVGMSEIVASEYFATFICVVDDQGRVALIDGTGTIAVVWDKSIAQNRNVPKWSPCEYVTFTQMRNQLVLCNGIDKPLSIQANKTCNYLVDLGTLQNARVPICKYVYSHLRYLIMGGDPVYPDRLYIGSRDTVGTFYGDPAPNDAVNIDLASYIPGDATITGINAFREFLVITFPNATMIAKLGVYSGSQHTPTFDDPMQEIGCVAHKSMTFLGDDLFILDVTGVQSLNRVFVTNKLHPTSMSDRILSALGKAMSKVPLFQTDATTPFAIYHHNDSKYLLFVPNNSNEAAVTETACFNLLYTPESKISAWSEYRGWNWRSTCKSLLHDIFFTRGTEIFQYGKDDLPYYGDFIGSEETWDDATAFTDHHGFSPVASPEDLGIPIPFAWELPWTDFAQRMNKKHTHYIQVDCDGDGEFSVMMFVDNFYKALDFGEPWQDELMFTDELGWEREDPILQPTVQLDLVGGDSEGYGLAPYGSAPFGGGRMAQEERLYAFPTTGKIHKLRIEGETNKKLNFKSISLLYSRGSIGR